MFKVNRVERRQSTARRHGDDADEEQSLSGEDGARPVDRRNTRSSPCGKTIRRRVGLDL